MATLIEIRRAQTFPVLLIDGGDFFNPYPYYELNDAALKILNVLQPDGFLTAEQEFQEDEKLIERLFKLLPVLGSNFKYNSYPKSELIVRLLQDHKKLVILGYLSPESFPGQLPGKLIFSEKQFQSIYNSLEKNSIIVVAFHGSKAALDRFLTDYPKTDLVLWAHAQSRLTNISDKPAVVGGGSDGEHLILIDLIFNKKKELLIQVERIPVSKKIPPNTAVKKIIEDF
ncbi:MAG TPA: hypothetical protein EYP36_04000, partial [Calditrichaeota bacterium]|nr:hypothetical protein [Calditrichota bacterium]